MHSNDYCSNTNDGVDGGDDDGDKRLFLKIYFILLLVNFLIEKHFY